MVAFLKLPDQDFGIALNLIDLVVSELPPTAAEADP
jgi:hypothetical protein